MDAEYFEKMKPTFLKPPSENTHVEGDPYHAVPAELKARPQWVLWRNETRQGKPTKVPYQINGQNAKSNDPSTWTDYQTVCKHQAAFDGIGYVFSSSDPYAGIDLDNCLENGSVKTWASPIVETLKKIAYGEVSPGGEGIKFFTKGLLPADIKHKVYLDEAKGEAIEAYDRGRYFTITGKGKGEIGDGQEAIDAIADAYLLPLPKPAKQKRSPARPTDAKSADEIIALMRQSRQCHKFEALMRGDTRGYGSQSEADMALCSVVAFWTQDARVIDAIFRTSQLMRDKWDNKHRSDGATYGQMTIQEALSTVRETYTPRREISETRRRRKPRDTRMRRRKPRDTRRKK